MCMRECVRACVQRIVEYEGTHLSLHVGPHALRVGLRDDEEGRELRRRGFVRYKE